VDRNNLPASYDFRSLNPQFSAAARETQNKHREVFHTVVQRPFGGLDMARKQIGDETSAPADDMYRSASDGAHHVHDNSSLIDRKTGKFRIDPVTGKPFVGGAVSGGDAGSLINSKANFTLAQDGNHFSMFVRTDQTPKGKLSQDWLHQQQEARARELYNDGRNGVSWKEATRRAALDTAARYSLGFYEGENGVLNKVPVDYGKRTGR
jgi:hypothetical protein